MAVISLAYAAASQAREAAISSRDVIITVTDYLECLKYYAPAGVFGFYEWFGKLVGLSFASYAAIKVMLDHPGIRFGAFIEAVGAFAVGILGIYSGTKASNDCFYAKTNNDTPKLEPEAASIVARYFIIRLVDNSLFVAAGSAEVISIFKACRHALVFVPLACAFHFFAAAAYYAGFTNFLNISRGMLRPILAISIPLLVLLIIAIIIVSIFTGGEFCGWFCAMILVLLVFFHIWAVGMGHILIGQASGDIWGSYIIGNKLGKAFLALTPIFPILALIGVPLQM